MALEGLQRALDTYIAGASGELHDMVLSAMPYTAAMAGMDELAKNAAMPTGRFMSTDTLSGNNARFTFEVAIPEGYGVSAETGPVADLEYPYREVQTSVTLQARKSYYANDDVIRMSDLVAFDEDANPDLVPFLRTKVNGLVKGTFKTINSDLFPVTNASPSHTGNSDTFAPTEERVMALSHALQTGQSGNAAGAATSYDYFGYNIGTNANTQAVNYGTHSSSFVFAQQTVFENIILPIRERGGNPDIALVDRGVYALLADFINDKTVVGVTETIAFGVQTLVIDGVRYILEPRLSELASAASQKREAYYLDSSKWSFKYETFNAEGGEKSAGMTGVAIKPARSRAFYAIDMGLVCRHVCTAPRYNGRAYNLTLS